jgi:ribosome-binding factor A
MKSRRVRRSELFAGCAEPGPGDGLDPRLEPRQAPGKVANRKALLLCGEAERTLSAVLAGECGDDVLRNLLVSSVKPAPTSARLLVTVYMAAPMGGVDAEAVLARLERARGMLRTEVAAALHRRKAPDLMFRVAEGP